MATKVSEHDYSEVFQVLRKSIAVLLTVCLISLCTIVFPVSVFAGEIDDEVSYPNGTIYFDINNTGWNDASYMELSVYRMGAYHKELYAGNSGYLTSDGVWEFSLDSDFFSEYFVISFCCEYGRTYDLTLDETCMGDTVYCDGTSYFDNDNVLTAHWKNADKTKCAPAHSLDANGNLIGEVWTKGVTRMIVLSQFMNTDYSTYKNKCHKSDKDILSALQNELELSNAELAAVCNINSGYLSDPFYFSADDYSGKDVVYLDTSAVKNKTNNLYAISCFISSDSGYDYDRFCAVPISPELWVVDCETIIPDIIGGSSSSGGSTSGDSRYIPKSSLKYLFFDAYGLHTRSCGFDESCYGDTIVFEGNTVSYYYDDSSYDVIKWKNSDNTKYGTPKTFDKDFNLIGDVTTDFHSRCNLLRAYIEERIPQIRDTTIDTDQYLIDEMASELGMHKADVACLIREADEIWNPDDSFLPDGYSYDKDTYYLLSSDTELPYGYYSFQFDSASGYYVIDVFGAKPYEASLDRYSSGNNWGGSSNGSSSGSRSGSGSSSTVNAGTEPTHTFIPDIRYSVVQYNGDGSFSTVSKEEITANYGSVYFFRPNEKNYCFGYNTFGEVGHNASGEGHSSSYSSYYPLQTPIIKSIKDTTDGIRITWEAISGAEKYRVYVKGVDQWISVGDTTNTEFVYGNVKSGNAYTFTLRCVSADGSKHTSNYDDYGATIRHLDTPVVTKLESTTKGNKITWNPVGGNSKYRVFVKSRNSWKALGDTYDTTFLHSSEGEGSIYAQLGTEYTYTVACLSYIGKTVTSAYNTDGWSITFTGGEPEYKVGDTDLDGNITISDVTEIQRHLAELTHFTDEKLALADTDGDGKVDIGDATHLQKYLAEFDGIVLGKQ